MTEERATRKLSGILSADAVGYSRLMQEDEATTIRTLEDSKRLMSELIEQFKGRVVDAPGDNLLAEFGSVVDATECAVKIQQELTTKNAELPDNRKMEFRIGVNLGDVVEEAGRIYGDGVNITARIEGLANPGGISISGIAFDQVKNKLKLGYEYLGEHSVKNIAEPVRVYKVLMEPEYVGKVIGEEKPKTTRWRWAALVSAVIVAFGAIAIWNFYFRTPPIEPASLDKMAFPLPDKPSIAILPFNNVSGDPDQEYIADGITENLINVFSKNPELFVIASNSVFTYKGKPVKVQQVSEDLGVRYILEGSVQKSGDRVRINAQLIDAIKGNHLWAESYDRNFEDLFALQDEITKNILMEMQVKLTWGETGHIFETKNLKAWEYSIKSLHLFYNASKGNNAKATELLNKAIELDSDYVLPLVLLGWIHWQKGQFGWSDSPADSFRQAFELGQRALEIDENESMVYSLFNTIYYVQGQHDKAISAGEKAIALSPNDPLAHAIQGESKKYAGRFEEAIKESETAIRLQPYYPDWYILSLCMSYYYVGRYEDAVAALNQALHRAEKQGKRSWLIHQILAVNYIQIGKEKQARYHAEELLKQFPVFNLEMARRFAPYKNPAHVEKQIADLRKAGIPEHPPLKLPDKPSIAVLPFVNMSGDIEQEYFSDGITEEIITALSKIPKVFVIARHSTFTYKRKSETVQKVGRDLGVQYVLEGSVRRAGNKLRITAKLIDATTEKHLWAERYDRDLKDVFDIQDEIALEIIRAMQVELTEGETARVTGRGTKNLDAYLRALQAYELMWKRWDKEGNIKARQLAKEAISLDPEYGFPFAIMSWSHMNDVWFQSTESPEESMRLANDAIQKALALDDSDHRIQEALSNLYIMQGKHDEAITAAKRQMELCPGGAEGYQNLGIALDFACRPREAIPMLEKALVLDPFPSGGLFRNLASAYRGVEQYEEAIDAGKKALQINTNDYFAYFIIARSYARLGRKEEARAAVANVLRISPEFSLNWYAEIVIKTISKECQSDYYDEIEFLRKVDVGLK